jgi:hypothetical protein
MKTLSPPGSFSSIARAADASRTILLTFGFPSRFGAALLQKLVEEPFKAPAMSNDPGAQLLDSHPHADQADPVLGVNHG